ncbi:MAG TPA: heme ABC exporter ATP-binding protein CcmA [Acidimicrobiales bacterium]|nr:heme ABC exporter ATP-binding protein CcmA [Acidimicrobiales bacterium]
MAEAIELRAAVAFSGSFPLLSGVNLSVEVGEVVHLSGANGAGKTSLLRVLVGLVPVSQGSISVLGYDLRADRRRVRREVDLLGHESFLYGDLDARENLAFWLGADHHSPSRVPSGVLEEAFMRVGLSERLSLTPVSKLSTGQRRRATLALLYARRRRLWLLDEPHAGLDADGREIVDDLIREASRSGTTVVFASHEIDHARTVATRSVVMVGGTIVAPVDGGLGDGDSDGA